MVFIYRCEIFVFVFLLLKFFFIYFFSSFYVANCDLKHYSAIWLLEVLEKGKFQSEMESSVLVLEWLHLHADFLNEQTISKIVKAVRVPRLKVYFLEQILMQCSHFDLTPQKINDIISFQNTGIQCESLPSEWFSEREYRSSNPFNEVYRWTPDELMESDFYPFRIDCSLPEMPVFLHYFGVIAVPTIEFKAPKVIITIKTFACIFPNLSHVDFDKPINNINCNFRCQFIIGNTVQEQSGLYSDSSITLSSILFQKIRYVLIIYFLSHD